MNIQRLLVAVVKMPGFVIFLLGKTLSFVGIFLMTFSISEAKEG